MNRGNHSFKINNQRHRLTIDREQREKERLETGSNTKMGTIISPFLKTHAFSRSPAKKSSLQKPRMMTQKVTRRSSLQMRILTQSNKQQTLPIRVENKLPSFSIKIDKKTSSDLLPKSNENPAMHLTNSFQASENLMHLDFLINELVRQLVHHLILFQSSSNTFIIKKEKTTEFITFLVESFKLDCAGERRHYDHAFPFAKPVMRNIVAHIQNGNTSAKQERLTLNKASTYLDYKSEHYTAEQKNISNSVSLLHLEKDSLDEHIQKMMELQSKLRKSNEQLQMEIAEENRKSSDLKKSYEAELMVYSRVKEDIEEATRRLEEIKTREENIFNFVDKQQNRTILREVSKDYKEIESEIYEFAVYLQSNELATTINYQPHPFSQIQQQLMEEMRSLNKNLIQNNTVSIEQKDREMRDFVLKSINYFKNKDIEMSKIAEFKTKCIRQYVSKMKRWLNNWELKQQFLGNLRKQFSIDSLRIQQEITDLMGSELCQSCRQLIKPILLLVRENYLKIEKNYELGNSFY